MQLLKCPYCDTEILLVPDLKKMGEAIERHVKQHQQKGTLEAIVEGAHVRSRLSQLVLEKIK